MTKITQPKKIKSELRNPCYGVGIHFIGIGGIGISALARYCRARIVQQARYENAKITGSDLTASEITDELQKLGIKIFIGPHKKTNISKNTDLVIYTAAVPENNPELQEAKKRQIPCLTYAQYLGELTKNYFTIAIAGSHGKSTTTAMTSLILIEAGFDPTVIIGTKLKEFGNSNFRSGKSKYLIIEADEWSGSFFNYHPDIAVITNIDKEHLDFYKNFDGVKRGFQKFIKNIKPGGVLIKFPYSLRTKIARVIKSILKIPGNHNVANALVAYQIGKKIGIDRITILKALSKYRGAWRRLDYRGKINGAKIFDDYGHHPTEIKATLQAAGELLTGNGKLWCIFQPHQAQRIKLLFKEFVSAFDNADILILVDIYEVAGREKTKITKAISSKILADAVKQRGKSEIYYIPRANDLADFLKRNLSPADIVIFMGAGNIYDISREIFSLLQI